MHWNGQSFRAQVADFVLRSHTIQRYGQKFLDACGPELTIQDWGVTYDELEPYYDRFEYLLGVSGKAGNIKGQIQQVIQALMVMTHVRPSHCEKRSAEAISIWVRTSVRGCFASLAMTANGCHCKERSDEAISPP